MNLKNPIVQGVSPSQNAIVQKKKSILSVTILTTYKTFELQTDIFLETESNFITLG